MRVIVLDTSVVSGLWRAVRDPDFVARARAARRAIGMADGTIAAAAAVRGFSVAARDTAPFEAAGLGVIDPWRGAANAFAFFS